jgi:lipoprotein-anchoring transpeptidase ErfK/SrfK
VLRSVRSDAGLAKSVVVLGLAGALALGAGTALVLQGSNGGITSTIQGPGPPPTPPPTVSVALAGEKNSTVPWQSHLSFRVTDGTLSSLVATTSAGTAVVGILSPTGWVSQHTLTPNETYALHAEVTSADGKTSTIDKTVKASPAEHVLHATLSPSGGTYGIGQPVIVRFDQKVKSAAARAAVLTKLQVTTVPAVAGAWRWYNSYEVHYRGPAYWKAGTKISVTAALAGLHVPDSDAWGAPDPVTRSFAIGRALVATVDITAHVMTVTIDGKLVRTVKVSTGRDQYPTKGGVHIVLTREKSHTYNSGTVGIPTAGPGGYYEKLPWSDRISNGGAFVHANPATVGVQGIRNVSHGCVNTSVADAKWFYENSLLGDVVNIIHSVVQPVTSDAGMYDWNFSYAEWSKGNLNG